MKGWGQQSPTPITQIPIPIFLPLAPISSFPLSLSPQLKHFICILQPYREIFKKYCKFIKQFILMAASVSVPKLTLPSLLSTQSPKSSVISHNLPIVSKSSQSQIYGVKLSYPSSLSFPSSVSTKSFIFAKVHYIIYIIM